MSAVEVSAVEVSKTIPYTESAQARLQELRLMRELIPRFHLPTGPQATARLSNAASVPPEFVELTAVAVTHEKSLVRGDGTPPEETRDLMSYGDAYSPVADELEALAQFIRHSVALARNQAGVEALTTYALAKRLAKRPDKAHLAPYVADMRRALGRGPKSPEALARRAARKAAKTTTQPS